MILKFRAKATFTGTIGSSKWVYSSLLRVDYEHKRLNLGGQDCQFDTLGQFINKYDCRNEEIYCGDFVMDDAGSYGEIEWNDDDCSFNIRFLDEYQPIDSSISKWGLVAGNIFDTPEFIVK